MLTKEFFTAGHAVFTVEPPASFIKERAEATKNDEKPEEWHSHYTYRVERVEFSRNDPLPEVRYFVRTLTGPDNTKDYTYMGELLGGTGELKATPATKFKPDATRWRIAARLFKAVWENRTDKVSEAGWRVHHEGMCCRCGRALTTPISVTNGIGPECADIMGIARVTVPEPEKVAPVAPAPKTKEKTSDPNPERRAGPVVCRAKGKGRGGKGKPASEPKPYRRKLRKPVC